MRIASFASFSLGLVTLAACGARTELEESLTGAPLEATDGGVSSAADGALSGSRDASAPPIADGGVLRPDLGPVTADGGVIGRDSGTTRDAGGPTRDAGGTTRDAGIDIAGCTTCAIQQCPQQANACLSNPQCLQALQCAAQCFAGGAGQGGLQCVQACNIPPAQFQTILGLLQCLGQNCQQQCAGGIGG